MTRLPPWILMAFLLAGALAAPARALPGGRPDVLILVAAAADGQDRIGVTYAGCVPHAQAHRDLAALRAATGWALRQIHVSDEASPFVHDRGRMTGAQCVAANVVRPATHGLAVQPFVLAFRPYAHVILTFFVGAGFQFRGLHDYADKDVEIALDRHGVTYTYRIFIRNPRFGRLSLPYLQPAARRRGRVEFALDFANGTRRRNRPCQEHL